MKITLLPGKIVGEVASIPSKSHLHRLMIYAAFADKNTLITSRATEAEDIIATMECLNALGAMISRNESGFSVTPVDLSCVPLGLDEPVLFPVCESGSTLRFLLPVVCALGIRAVFEMKGRLPERPLAPLDEQLKNHGINIWREGREFLHVEGRLEPGGDYFLPGDVSSQYITGLIMALSLLDNPSTLTVGTPIESVGYLDMTLDVAEVFGVKPESQNNRLDSSESVEYKIRGGGIFVSPGQVDTEGDWSNSAFWLCAGAMPKGKVTLTGLDKNSSQGDREVSHILSRMGANIEWSGNALVSEEKERLATEIDASAIPDLIPTLAAVAAVSKGTTIVVNAARLRIKESDRLMAIANTLSALGAEIRETADGLVIEGKDSLRGGTVDAHGDHRIAMMAAIASAACTEPVTIIGAQAVNKSYPKFWRDLELMGKRIQEE